MATDSRLRRLLSDCERLVRDESVALSTQDFEALQRVQGCILPLFAELRQLMAAVPRESGNELIRQRVAALIVAEESNLAQVQAMLGRARMEKQELLAACLRLRGLSGVYGDSSAGQSGFCAHG